MIERHLVTAGIEVAVYGPAPVLASLHWYLDRLVPNWQVSATSIESQRVFCLENQETDFARPSGVRSDSYPVCPLRRRACLSSSCLDQEPSAARRLPKCASGTLGESNPLPRIGPL
jgi:hypothetical protein